MIHAPTDARDFAAYVRKQPQQQVVRQLNYTVCALGCYYAAAGQPFEHNQEFIHRPLMQYLRASGLLFEINACGTWGKISKVLAKYGY